MSSKTSKLAITAALAFISRHRQECLRDRATQLAGFGNEIAHRECRDAGDREFNPLGIVVPQKGRAARVVRFWRAFRDYKHGKDGPLRVAEAELQACLDATAQRNG